MGRRFIFVGTRCVRRVWGKFQILNIGRSKVICVL